MKKLFAMLLALCLMCSVVSAMAEGNATTDVMLGNVHFQIPAELTAQELSSSDALYFQQFVEADYAVQIMVFDYEKADVSLQVLKGADDQINNLFWCYSIFSALIGEDDDETALFLCNYASRLDGTMPDGQALLYFDTDTLCLAAHYYRNMGCMVMVLAQDENMDGARCHEIALSIAGSFRIDGVTEEQMAADAEAARIAAEQAAMQKYVVITNSSANIRSGPGGDYAKVTTARQGDTFPLIGEDGNWYIIDVNGQTGYVTKSLSAIQ